MQEVKNQPCSSIKVEKQRVQRKKELLNRKKKNLFALWQQELLSYPQPQLMS
ncbi:hypothetical protein NK662_23500 [Ectobacillus sp. SYSU M60031]|uniref:Uncharacterized protein n=1 Tax=Ectobacillus ponti TaxID=2961894 RepID=A0AA42BVB8_9BACI|nr:hypothetical protein [Ectobacillus ponti]